MHLLLSEYGIPMSGREKYLWREGYHGETR